MLDSIECYYRVRCNVVLPITEHNLDEGLQVEYISLSSVLGFLLMSLS
jgi:hypothetical protein